jgi:hypothetical protein
MRIQRSHNLFPDLLVARYNLAAWQKQDGNSIYFIGREVERAGMFGEPDVGVLKLFEVNDEGTVLHERVIWKPVFDGLNLEDPRALELPDQRLIIGLTAVLRDTKGVPTPFPAIIKIDGHYTWSSELPPFLVITSFGPGKNLTPIDAMTYLFRPDDPDYYHKIMVISLHNQIPEKVDVLTFPTDLPWASWRIGTTMPPIWFNPEEALFIIHGITKQYIDGREKYIYSIGRAKLTRKDNVFRVTVMPEPILVPDDFMQADGGKAVQELHPDYRRVVYACGGVIKRQKKDTLSLYVNVGDRATFEVEFSLAELKVGLF